MISFEGFMFNQKYEGSKFLKFKCRHSGCNALLKIYKSDFVVKLEGIHSHTVPTFELELQKFKNMSPEATKKKKRLFDNVTI